MVSVTLKWASLRYQREIRCANCVSWRFLDWTALKMKDWPYLSPCLMRRPRFIVFIIFIIVVVNLFPVSHNAMRWKHAQSNVPPHDENGLLTHFSSVADWITILALPCPISVRQYVFQTYQLCEKLQRCVYGLSSWDFFMWDSSITSFLLSM